MLCGRVLKGCDEDDTLPYQDDTAMGLLSTVNYQLTTLKKTFVIVNSVEIQTTFKIIDLGLKTP